MLDISLRPLKDRIFDPLCSTIPSSISPLHLTGAAFLSGLASCLAATFAQPHTAVSLWLLNRVLDCLDGAVARQRNQSSDLGGFLDLLGDFIVYSAIPICCALGLESSTSDAAVVRRRWLAVALAEASFHVNNFVLFFVAAVTERRKAEKAVKGQKGDGGRVKELTSVSMRPALVEGTESGVIFTLMLAAPAWTEVLCWVLAAGVVVGIVQRVGWTVGALSD